MRQATTEYTMRSTKAIATRITQAIHRDQAPADVAADPGMVARMYAGDWCSDMTPDARVRVAAAVTAIINAGSQS